MMMRRRRRKRTTGFINHCDTCCYNSTKVHSDTIKGVEDDINDEKIGHVAGENNCIIIAMDSYFLMEEDNGSVVIGDVDAEDKDDDYGVYYANKELNQM